jgi:hypothetical protein
MSKTVDEAMGELEAAMNPDQRIWLMERSKAGYWGVAIVRDLPAEEWPEPDLFGVIPEADKFRAIAYRRHESLAQAISDVAREVRIYNSPELDPDVKQG